MSFAAFQQDYAVKTDDVAKARRALEDELRRRIFRVVGGEGAGTTSFPSTAHSVHMLRARWLGLWFLNTLIATLGVAITIGFSLRILQNHSSVLRLEFGWSRHLIISS